MHVTCESVYDKEREIESSPVSNKTLKVTPHTQQNFNLITSTVSVCYIMLHIIPDAVWYDAGCYQAFP